MFEEAGMSNDMPAVLAFITVAPMRDAAGR